MKGTRAVRGGVIAVMAIGALRLSAQTASAGSETSAAAGKNDGVQGGARGDAGQSAKNVTERTFYLTSTSLFNEANEVVNALRNAMEPYSKIILVPSRNAIVVEASPEQMSLAQKLLTDLDRPKKAYRLTFTVSELESGKRIGVQHFAMVMVAGQRSSLKQGSKVPVVTGSYDPGRPSQNTQVTYLDVGMNFDATLEENGDGVQLKSKVEQSSLAEEKSGVGPQDPVVRQTVLEGISHLPVGRPLVIGSLDVPGSTRHFEVEALVERERP